MDITTFLNMLNPCYHFEYFPTDKILIVWNGSNYFNAYRVPSIDYICGFGFGNRKLSREEVEFWVRTLHEFIINYNL